MKNLLISNDDGVQSPGLWALKEHFERDYRVFMVAPDRERSATSHSISLHDPIRLKVVEEGSVYALDGTPVDAVHVALLGLVENHVDCVLTGVNIGLNLGRIAGAGLDQHLHTHIVPRWQGDANFMPVVGHTRVMSDSLPSMYAKLKKALEDRLAQS